MTDKDQKPAQQDERIAPQAPRGAEGRVAVSKRETRGRKRVASTIAGVAVCAVVILACVFGLQAAGVFSQAPQEPQLVAGQDAAEPSLGTEDNAGQASDAADDDSDKNAAKKSKKKSASSKEKSAGKKASDASNKKASNSSSASKKSDSAKASSGSSTKKDTVKPSADSDTITVTLSIDGSRAGSMDTASRAESKVELKKGASVFDALAATGVSIGGDSYYVSAINGLAEKQCGTYSGWMYSVNGEYPNKTCGDYKLHGSEKIIWVYTCDLGNDL